MSSTDAKDKQVPTKSQSENENSENKLLDPKQADKAAEQEFKSKYPGFGSRPSGLAQRKISSTGGRQYFDSGDYNKSGSRKEKVQIASFPHATNPEDIHSHPSPMGIPPHLAHMRAKPKAAPSKLSAPVAVSRKSPLAD